MKKGHLINNWILSLILSLLLIAYSLKWLISSFMTFEIQILSGPNARGYLVFKFIIPILLFIGGSILTYLATKPSPIISIKTNHKRYKIPLIEFKRSGALNDLIAFLSERVNLV
ncbi:hypothetical protein KDU71_08595 [Carboxylicivirga sediminis]|uniref:Uncharacterized protein n=1 Tax=Carboxylicivirga sediminis TaxID=2006564 RepID=A0A941F3F3_9BACT|nr:hypothetical protein [Carboxylicivirga sediminis]MBR8535614.1 hypothetical protein [Carboxylicivirga sediminis]